MFWMFERMPLPIIAAIFGGTAGAIMERYGVGINYRDLVTMSGANKNGVGVESQAFAEAKRRLILREGRRNDVYRDTRGFLTVGIGHKVVASDRLKLGDRISDSRVDAFFAEDVRKAFNAALSQARQINQYNVEMIAALTSVNFQLGIYWTLEWGNTWALLKRGDKAGAAAAIRRIQSSAWSRQTPTRTNDFVQSIKSVYGVA